eukprot:3169354-Pleurochrysis_carterae.AAC.3
MALRAETYSTTGPDVECTKSRSACDQASAMGYPSSGPVEGSGGKLTKYNRTAGRLIARGSAKRKHLTISRSYSADRTNGSPSGTKFSQICRRLSLASQRISTPDGRNTPQASALLPEAPQIPVLMLGQGTLRAHATSSPPPGGV